jgi:hypothetical protein
VRGDEEVVGSEALVKAGAAHHVEDDSLHVRCRLASSAASPPGLIQAPCADERTMRTPGRGHSSERNDASQKGAE